VTNAPLVYFENSFAVLSSCVGWNFKSNGGDQFAVEKPPVGCGEPSPRDTCFVTSFHSCSKEQMINLKEVGAAPSFMDLLQPEIVISEW